MPSGEADRAVNDARLHERGCLFCLRSDGGFRSREHIFPEALGNQEHILPAGVVCDRCNHGPLSLADDALVSFPPIALLIGERGIGGKTGKARVVDVGGTQVWWSGKGELNVATNSKRVTSGMRGFPREPGKLRLKGSRSTPARFRAIVRSVWKSTLEFIYVDHGSEEAYSEKYDEARQAVLDVKGAKGWAVCPKEASTHEEMRLTYQFVSVNSRPSVPVETDVFGVIIRTDLLLRDLDIGHLAGSGALNVWTF